jgi:hypothetical protein
MELNLSKAARRRTKDVIKNEAERVKRDSLTILAQSVIEMRERRERLNANGSRGTVSFLTMFNDQLVDFVYYDSEKDEYRAVEWESEATHQLIPTAWNKEPNPYTPSKMFALSVCAKPLRPRLKQTNIKIKKLFPKKGPTYKLTASLNGKQSVLKYIVIAMRAKVKLSIIPRLSNKECDLLYRNLKRASLIKRFGDD